MGILRYQNGIHSIAISHVLALSPGSAEAENPGASHKLIPSESTNQIFCLLTISRMGVDKIRLRQEMEKMKANSSASLRSMEEFCQKFDHSVNGPMGRPMPNTVGTMGMGHPMTGYEGSYIQPGMAHMGQFRPMKDAQDMLGETALSAASAAQQGKTESKKHPSLPKEAVAMMMEWLRNHKDNPYPNDDEKAMLIKQTGLSINQINYWFTNARRRILPKWAQCKT
ncbi:hypothetical protein RRG08_043724 [Elysia crispata]|uniref:Homeobox domain-containing protein n=1 Tax=Elysia crispata TaxID=231223 RepID=A0AAE0ZN57_9GAST|nr:hypothetical protein RRG08_043724 [Elysia crispata]